MSSREVPETWAKAMERRGFTHNGKPSISRLAGETTLAIETVRRMVLAIGTPEQRNVNQVADALGVSRIEVNEWMGIAREVEETYEPPADADLMGTEQRRAVDRIIQLLIEEKQKAGEAHVRAASTNASVTPIGISVESIKIPPIDASGDASSEERPAARKVGRAPRGKRKRAPEPDSQHIE